MQNNPFLEYPELGVEDARIQRQRALSQAMLQQGLTPQAAPQNPGRFTTRQSPLAPIAQLAQVYLGSKGAKAADDASQNLGTKYTEMMQSGVRDYMSKRGGAPEVPMPDAELGGGPGRPEVTPDAAVSEALMSRNPMVRGLAKMDYERMNSEKVVPEGGALVRGGRPVFTNPKVAEGEIPENWQSMLPPGVKPGPARGTFYAKGAGGQEDLYQQKWDRGKLVGTQKIDNAPQVNLKGPMTTGPRVGADTAFREAAQHLSKIGANAQSGVQMKDALGEMKVLDQQGIFSNVTSGPVTFMNNLAKSLGGTLTPEQQTKLQNTETFDSTGIGVWQELVSKFGGNRGVTKEEAEKILHMIPLAKHDPASRMQIYGILERAADRQVQRFQRANQMYFRAVTADDPSMLAPLFEEVYVPKAGNIPPGNRGPQPVGTLKPYNE